MPEISLNKPTRASSLSHWLNYLETLYPQIIELGLERVSVVAKKMNLCRPADIVFTVAGTNGKGTTCRALEMILIEAGYKVGVYSSPHILRYTERVRIQGKELTEKQHIDSLAFINEQRAEKPLTYFEFCTLSALKLFQENHVDVAILEVGLGGRLDATNIVEPDVSVITSIGLDHVKWLGDTRELIGQEKAGILRKNKPAVIGEPDMPMSIRERVEQLSCQKVFCYPNKDFIWRYEENNDNWNFHYNNYHYLHLPIPKIPLSNAATALAALLSSPVTVTDTHIRQGLQKTALWGRLQVIQKQPLVILDVAHNAHAGHYLATQLQRLRKNKDKVRVVIGMLADKDIAETIESLRNNIDIWYVASLVVPRGASKETLLACLPTETVYAFDDVIDAWQQAVKDAEKNDLVIVIGSFVTVGKILEHIGLQEFIDNEISPIL